MRQMLHIKSLYPVTPKLPNSHTPKPPNPHTPKLPYLHTLLLALLLAGCSETVNPLVEEERPFTIFGYLDPSASIQTVRVIPITKRIDEPFEETIDASVVSVDMETNETRVWRDSVVTFESDKRGHVFVSNFTPEYERTYRLEVSRSDGAVSSVEVNVPPQINAIRPPLNTSSTQLAYQLEAVDRPNIVQAEMQYLAVALQPPSEPGPIFHPVEISYRGKETPSPAGWQVEVDIREDYKIIEAEFERNCLTTEYITVRTMQFVLFIGDEAWTPPGNVFDEDVLAQPDVFSNVENGFGFFGAGYALRFNAIQPGSVLQRAGFTADSPCMDVPPDDPSCRVIPPCFEM